MQNKYAGDAGLWKIGMLRSLCQDNMKKGCRFYRQPFCGLGGQYAFSRSRNQPLF
ncbi:hypothetical protein SDC9_147897 [bioreactor metagenome]|uniref:Uncharacterized protein n=1 Tax=bioreactor metagenome TaxID=1076179 RepID=A0A645EFN9_9ZZZZ